MPCRHSGNNDNSNAPCEQSTPGNNGVSIIFEEYPEDPIRSGGNYQISYRNADNVMYPSTFIPDPARNFFSTHFDAPAMCGKYSEASTNEFFQTGTRYYDYVPNELSFDLQDSERWFAYIYDTSGGKGAGHSGIAAFYIETEDRTTTVTTPSSGTEGQPGYDPGSSSSSADAGARCIPCTNFSCTAASTELKYTGTPDLTGDPDCPHPTLFGIGTSSDKVVFRYNALSTTVPDTVLDFSFSYDGVTYTDVFDTNEGNTTFESPQNPWVQGDETFFDFQVFTMENQPTATGFRIKVEITPRYDESGATPVFQGTNWRVTELVAGGTGYSANNTFALSYPVTHNDGTTSTLTMNVKVTSVGPLTIPSGSTSFNLLRPGDTINGHTITRTFHTDYSNFSYHVLYLDGSGSAFTKDTQYTSSRQHQITAVAGHGIPDRACLIGLYEFLEKSVQFLTADLDKEAIDTLTTAIQPVAEGIITNGRVTGINIVDGGSGWNQTGTEPVLNITQPASENGIPAKVKGTFSNGVLTAVQITDAGAGYDGGFDEDAGVNNRPRLFVENIYRDIPTEKEHEGYSTQTLQDFKDLLTTLPNTVENGVEKSPIASDAIQEIEELYNARKKVIEETERIPRYEVRPDINRVREQEFAQELYRREDIEPLKQEYTSKYNVDHLNQTPITEELKNIYRDEKAADQPRRDATFEALIQDVIPRKERYQENLVETVQGSLTQLPYASEYTKYLMKQYRPDTTRQTSIQVSLTCTPVNIGKSHFTCGVPGSSSRADETTTDDQGNSTTISYLYSMSPLLGPGCQEWTAQGEITIFNNFTRSIDRVSEATKAYGNPYDPGFAN